MQGRVEGARGKVTCAFAAMRRSATPISFGNDILFATVSSFELPEWDPDDGDYGCPLCDRDLPITPKP